MQKNIILINPPRYDLLPFHTIRDVPYGLLKIGGHFLSLGHKVTLINCMESKLDLRTERKIKCGNYENEGRERDVVYLGTPFEEIAEKLKSIKNPDEIWVSSTMTYYWRAVHEVIDIAKKIHPNTPVILGGIYASLCPEHARKSKADHIHEGPYLPAEKSRTALELLNKIPNYFIIKYTRGCPHNCSYCAVTKLEGHKMDFMDADRFVEELEEKYHKFGIKSFHLWESNLLVDSRNRFEKVLDKILEKKLPIHLKFPEGLQPSLVYPELAWKMRKVGIINFALPLESADEEMYDRFHKPSTLKQFDRAVNIFKDAGFEPKQIRIFVLVGMPNQTIESIVKSDFKVLSMNCYLSNLRFTPIPGTEEYENNKEMLKDKELEDLHPVAYSMANPRMTVEDLETVRGLNSKKSLYDLIFMGRNNVSRIFKSLIKDHLVDIERFGDKTGRDIQILDNKPSKKIVTVGLIPKLKGLRQEGGFYAFYYPTPKCALQQGAKNIGMAFNIPSTCDNCLKLLVEGCEHHPVREITEDDVAESFKLNKDSIKEECKRCKHYKRKQCRMLCVQLKENDRRKK